MAEAAATTTTTTDLTLLKRLWRFIAPWKASLFGAIALNLVEVGANLAQPLLLAVGIDEYIRTGQLDGLGVVALGYLAVVMVGFTAHGIGLYLISSTGLRTLASLRSTVFRHVLDQGQRFFDRRTSGSLMTRTTNDVDAIQESLMMGAVGMITDGLMILGITVTMLILDWKLTLVSFAASPLIVLTVNLFRKKLRALSLVIRRSLSRLNGYFAEAIYGMNVLQLYGAQDRARDEFRELSYEYLDAYRRSNWWDAGLYAVMDGMSALSIGLLLWFGAGQYDPATGASGVEGAVTLGLLVAFIDYLRRVYVPIREFSGRLATLQRAVAALERIFGLLDTSDRIEEGGTGLGRADGNVRFEGVSFKYSPERPLVLRDIDLAVDPGEVVALVGATGSGKTTIGKVLTRMYDGYTGSVTVDGHELRDLDVRDLRRNVTVVHQDVFLFKASIADNIGLWNPDISREAIEQAAKLARAHTFITDHPEGYDRVLTERGANLSSGQKQLLAIARAFARDAPIVILDEATASVDSVTEQLIDEAIAELLARKTVIVIAHRLSTILRADRIAVLHHGRIVEQGTHDALMARDGRYKILVETGFAL